MNRTFPVPADTSDPPELSEDDRVRAYRETWLLRLGFTAAESVALADGPAGQERVEGLLEQGCSHRLVASILA